MNKKWISWDELGKQAKTTTGGRLVDLSENALPSLKCKNWVISQNPEFKKLIVTSDELDEFAVAKWIEKFSYLGHGNSLALDRPKTGCVYAHRPICLNTGPGSLTFYFVPHPEYPAGQEPKRPPAQYD